MHKCPPNEYSDSIKKFFSSFNQSIISNNNFDKMKLSRYATVPASLHHTTKQKMFYELGSRSFTQFSILFFSSTHQEEWLFVVKIKSTAPLVYKFIKNTEKRNLQETGGVQKRRGDCYTNVLVVYTVSKTK